MRDIQAYRKLVKACRRLAGEGLVVATDGNLSLKLSDQLFLITRSGLAKSDVLMKDLLEMDAQGTVLGSGKASIEKHLHLAIYQAQPEVKGICHGHPFYATWLAQHYTLEMRHLLIDAEIRFLNIGVVPDLPPGSLDLAKAVGQLAMDHDVLLIPRHGAITFSVSINEAVERMIALERWARICYADKVT